METKPETTRKRKSSGALGVVLLASVAVILLAAWTWEAPQPPPDPKPDPDPDPDPKPDPKPDPDPDPDPKPTPACPPSPGKVLWNDETMGRDQAAWQATTGNAAAQENSPSTTVPGMMTYLGYAYSPAGLRDFQAEYNAVSGAWVKDPNAFFGHRFGGTLAVDGDYGPETRRALAIAYTIQVKRPKGQNWDNIVQRAKQVCGG